MQQIAVGNILEGKVTGITKFGAFIDLGDGKVGMVHISEVASTYVKEITDYIKDGDIVKVKVLTISDDGKISLSIKKAQEANRREYTPKSNGPRGDFGLSSKKSNENLSFEDMMAKFKQTSDDKMSDLKKYMDVKQKGSGPKRPRTRT